MNIVIAGGGTGGHLYPCLALADMFKMRGVTEILFIGTAAGLEARVIPQHGFRLETIDAEGWVGKTFLRKIRGLFFMGAGIVQSLKSLRRFSPNLVIGIGGYTAMPVLLAAIFLRIKRIILEPNAMPGMANQLLAPFVHLTVTAFPETEHLLRARKVACLGVPVRSEILSGSQKKDAGKPATLLVLGGSQGAHAINRAMIEALPFLAGQSITIIHQTGEKDWGIVKAAYEKHRINARVEKFIEKMAQVYAGSDLVVSRAGAGVLSELAVMGMPSLLIPFPYAKGHQAKNAEPFVACGAAEMILERDLIKEDARSAGGKLAERILNLFSHPEKLSEMGMAARRLGHPDAASNIVSSCFELVGEGG